MVINAVARRLVIDPLAIVNIAVSVDQATPAINFVVAPPAFVNAAVRKNHAALALSDILSINPNVVMFHNYLPFALVPTMVLKLNHSTPHNNSSRSVIRLLVVVKVAEASAYLSDHILGISLFAEGSWQRLLLHLLLRDRLFSELAGKTVVAGGCELSDHISRILLRRRLVLAAEDVHEINWVIFCGTLLLLLTSVEVEVKVAVLGLLLRADGGIEVEVIDVVVAGLLRLGVNGKIIKVGSKVDILFIIFGLLMSRHPLLLLLLGGPLRRFNGRTNLSILVTAANVLLDWVPLRLGLLRVLEVRLERTLSAALVHQMLKRLVIDSELIPIIVLGD